MMNDFLSEAGVPRRHRLMLDQMEHSGPAWELREKLVALSGTGYLIALIGLAGTGKTQIAVSLVEQRCDTKRARYLTALDVVIRIKASYKPNSTETEEDIIHDLVVPTLLVVDELDVRTHSPWEDTVLRHMINRRYNAEHDTLLISNSTKEEFVETIGQSVVSRMDQTGGIITCDWPSFRK